MSEAKNSSLVIEIITNAMIDEPDDPKPLAALAEIRAAQMDWSNLGSAVSQYVKLIKYKTGQPLEDIPSVLFDDDDIRLRVLQVWSACDGRNRNSFRRLGEALRQLDYFVPPSLPKHSDTESLSKFSPRFHYYQNLYVVNQDQLSLWRDWVDDYDFQNFRGETFLSQAAAHHPGVLGAKALHDAYQLQLQYARSIDRLGALEAFQDDGLFGGCRFNIEGAIVSRDILDSALELNFLARHTGIVQSDPLILVDIGAGWGRFVHRFLSLYPNAKAWALDVVPFSSFCCEHYLRTRGLLTRTTVGAQALLRDLPKGSVNIACNIHSWSEAPLASIEKWLDALARLEVRYLFLVPHTVNAVSSEADDQTKPIVPAVLARGYRIIAEQPKYGVSQFFAENALYPYVYYYLFERV